MRYGADTRWMEKTVNGTVPSTNAFFGTDPALYLIKSCRVAWGRLRPNSG